MAKQIVVLGGGLSGVASGNTVLERGGHVVLLDKSAFCGGNSSKATSGINGANTKSQRNKNITDSTELFISDTKKGGAKKPDLVSVLCGNSGADVEWLMDHFALDLSLVARLGGHSQPRTHRGKERFPGMTITYALIQMLENIAERHPDKARIITKAHAKELLLSNGAVVGCAYVKNGSRFEESGPVIICTGGFGADFTVDSLLAHHRPDLLHLPTTNGVHCTGDGIKMGQAIGASTIDLEWVQVHPTGLVKPDEPDVKIKFLAAEALRGVGGLVLDANGNRFCNELGRRDYVTGEMWKNKPPFRLVLNEAASEEIIWHCKHYTGRGVMKQFNSGVELAQEMGIDVSVLERTHDIHFEAASKMAKYPDDGPYDAYPSGKSWDEPSGKTRCGKKFYTNLIDGSAVRTQKFFVAIITPVIHYCMGGLEIDTDSRVIKENGEVIPGLYAAGEVAGGVHGNNRLGGNSLLDCVVFGRVAGAHAVKYLIGGNASPVSLAELSGPSQTVVAKTPLKEASVASKEDADGYTMEEVQKHNTSTDCWVVLHGRVLNVTKFLKDHPGGELAIMTFAGKDATKEFDMIHPAGVVEKYAPYAVIGKLRSEGAESGSAVATAGGGSSIANHHAWGEYDGHNWRMEGLEHNPGALIINFDAYIGATIHLLYAVCGSVLRTIFSPKVFQGTFTYNHSDKRALTRSAIFLIFFLVIHAVGNLHVFLGPDDFNGYGYFYVRLYWSGFGLPANIVEEYVLLSALLHATVAILRTRTIWKNRNRYDGKVNSGRELAKYTGHLVSRFMKDLLDGSLSLILTGLLLGLFMTIHLFQFRFGATQDYYIRVPPWMINWYGIFSLNLFWDYDTKLPLMGVRDIYQLEFDLFRSGGWVAFYIASVCVFMVHACLGWNKAVSTPKFGIPQGHQKLVKWFGYIIFWVLGFIYISYPVYCVLPHTLETGWTHLDTKLCDKLNEKRDKFIAENPELPKPPPYLQCCGSPSQCLEWK